MTHLAIASKAADDGAHARSGRREGAPKEPAVVERDVLGTVSAASVGRVAPYANRSYVEEILGGEDGGELE
jgi:hypothetical protein